MKNPELLSRLFVQKSREGLKYFVTKSRIGRFGALFLTKRRSKIDVYIVLWLEPAFWFWTLGRIVDEATDIVSWDAEGLRAYWRSNWNKVDVATNVLAIACVGVRVGCVLGGDEPLPTAEHASDMAYDDGWTSAGALRSDIVVGVGAITGINEFHQHVVGKRIQCFRPIECDG